MSSIPEPSVHVTQTFVTPGVSVGTPAMPSVLVGVCMQLVDAFDDDQNPQEDALAGTYRDGYGTITYDLPSLMEETSLSSFEDDIRVFLVYSTTKRELNSVYDEATLVDNDIGDFTFATLKWTDATAIYLQLGVEAGDVVRFDYLGATIDVPIASVDADTELTLKAGYVPENLAGVTYDIIRNPAEFVYDAGADAMATLGDADDYIVFTTVGDYIGAVGDTLVLNIVDSYHYVERTDGVCGDCIFGSALGGGVGFLAGVGPVGAVSGFYVLVGAAAALQVLYEVHNVVSDTELILDTGLGVGLAGQTYSVGASVATGTDGATDGIGTTFTSAGAAFDTTIPNAGVPGAPTFTTYIYIEGDGVYEVTNILSATQLTINPAAGLGLTGQTYRVVVESMTDADGTTGALTDFVSIAGGLSTLLTPTTKSVNVAEADAAAIDSVTDAYHLVLAAPGLAASGRALSFTVVDTTSALALSWDAASTTVTIQIERALGLSSSTYAEIENAITDPLDAAYNALVSAVITAALGGAVGTGVTTITGTSVPISEAFDGGADDDQLILDADLLGSSTPTAKVYVSYKALRLDVSDQASDPTLLVLTDTDDIEDQLGEISTRNPLALAAYFALSAGPSRSIRVLGVGEVSASRPYGTAEGFTSALQFLEGYNVHAIAVMTQDPLAHQALSSHVDAMSAGDIEAKRIGLFNTAMPLYATATLVASGTEGNTGTFSGQNPAYFEASTDFDAAGVLAGDLLVVTALSGSTQAPDVVNGTLGPLYGIEITDVDPTDNFKLRLDASAGVGVAWDSLVDVSFTVYRAGAAITSSTDQAEAIALTSEAYANRRLVHVWPAVVTGTVKGTDTILDGFYAAAALAGVLNVKVATQPLTRTVIPGFTGLKYSNGYFSRSQLDRIAGGGTLILIQETSGGPLVVRHQLTTDTSSVQKRELSMTRMYDYAAAFIKQGITRPGTKNLTQGFIDATATVIAGLCDRLVSYGFRSASLVSIAIDPVEVDKLLLKVRVDAPPPANYFEIDMEI